MRIAGSTLCAAAGSLLAPEMVQCNHIIVQCVSRPRRDTYLPSHSTGYPPVPSQEIGMATLARRRLFFGRHRDEAEALQEQVTALETALSKCADVAGRWTEFRRTVTAAIAAGCLVLGFTLGVYHKPILHTVAGLGHVIGLGNPVMDADAAYASYQSSNYARALRQARPLAEEGDARAQSLLGLLLYRGRGTVQDFPAAVMWFRRAADADDAAAMFYLGVMFADGQGVPQDYAEAAKWYRRAAERGDAQAQYNLGLAFAKGEGVAADPVAAHMWLNLSTARFPVADSLRRSTAANSRDAVAAKMTPAELAEAQRLARDWKPK
jgi:uncharacterized protein